MLRLTPSAVAYFSKYLATHASGVLVFSVKKSGCSGLRYVNEVCEAPEDAIVHESHGWQFYVKQDSLAYLSSVTVDCESHALGQQKVVYRNEQAENVCGCGESFSARILDEAS